MQSFADEKDDDISDGASFMRTFHTHEENAEWLKKVEEKYGDKLDKLLGNDYLVERVIDALRARNRCCEIFSTVDAHLEMYEKYSMATLLETPLKNEAILKQYWPVYMGGSDKYGHPVFYDDLLSMNLHKVVQVFAKSANGHDLSDDQIEHEPYHHHANDDDKLFDFCSKFRIKFYMQMAEYKRMQSEKFKTIIFKHVLVMDLSNFSYYKVASHSAMYFKIAKMVLQREQLLYPQTVHKIYLINCPWTFTLVW
eukprot:CAMPEP_0202692790 /NCGR_PEP_ID=MMETSP1385-20130828/7089_1 /ASSEMBLY_ACC=CAM_ASM_000861 /TAXON_ID=933848 /ORGANISM="Elphidium margaritaceum" /LENGTH=252 /DNA_ID=CAMNT_0049348385 /DNA_START=29 /DNA_END=784 /DNA_ORIENTATION=-